MRRFGDIGQIRGAEEITFILISPLIDWPDVEHSMPDVWSSMILAGETRYSGRPEGVGTLGPVKTTDPKIEWKT